MPRSADGGSASGGSRCAQAPPQPHDRGVCPEQSGLQRYRAPAIGRRNAGRRLPALRQTGAVARYDRADPLAGMQYNIPAVATRAVTDPRRRNHPPIILVSGGSASLCRRCRIASEGAEVSSDQALAWHLVAFATEWRSNIAARPNSLAKVVEPFCARADLKSSAIETVPQIGAGSCRCISSPETVRPVPIVQTRPKP